MEQKYPKFFVGAFVVNSRGELFLWRKQNEYFTCPNFKVLWGETIEETLRKGLKEKIGFDIAEHQFIDLVEGLHIKMSEGEETNMIFADYRITVVDENAFFPTSEYKEREFHWLKPEEWLTNEESAFGPYITGTIRRLCAT